MKKYVNKLKRIVAVMLSVAMVVSLFQWDLLRAVAEGETTTPVLDFIPANTEPEKSATFTEYAYIKSDSVKVYYDYTYGSSGKEFTGVKNEKIEISQSFTYTVDGKEIVLYYYSDYDFSGTMYDAQNAGYRFIYAGDISSEVVEEPEASASPSPEATASPTVEPTATPEASASPDVDDDISGIKDFGLLDFDAYIIPETLTIYKNHIDDVEQKVVENVAGEKLHVWFFYELEDGTIKYKVEYTGENAAITTAITEGYEFVKSIDVSKIAVDDETGVSVTGNLPQDVTVTVAQTDVADLPLTNSEIAISEKSLFYDVTLKQNDATYTPEAGVTVTFPKDKVPFGIGTTYYAYHIKDDGTVETYGTYEYDGGDIAVKFDSLSYVGIAEAEANFNFKDLGEFTKTELAPEQAGVFVGDSITLYDSVDTDTVKQITVEGLAGKAISAFYKITFANSDLVLYQYYMVDNTDALYNTVKDYALVAEGNVDFTTSEGPTEDEIANDYEQLLQSGILKDFEVAYEVAENNGTLEKFTENQKAEIETIKVILEEMNQATVDWTEIAATVNVSGQGIKLYRNPVSRPNDYVLANEVEPNSDETTEVEIEEIDFTEATITGKYTDADDKSYFVIDTEDWSVFEGRVPYRYIAQTDVVLLDKSVNLNTTGAFLEDTVKLYSNYSDDMSYVEITDGTSRGSFTIYYEIITTDYEGVQEHWYWISTPNWTDANGNSVGYSRYVKTKDVYLVTSMTDATGVSVYGDIPEGATLSVSTAAAADTELADGIHLLGDNSLFYDVTLLDENGNETQPGAGGITVTFPESAVLACGIGVGDKYHVYHIHDGEIEKTGPFVYNGGTISAKFDNLSYTGVIETGIILDIADDATYTKETLDYPIATISLNEITVYENFTDGAGGIEISDAQNASIELVEKITYTDGTELYFFNLVETSSTDLEYAVRTLSYKFIPAEYVNTDGDNNYDQLYNDLLATETYEESDEIISGYTEDEYQTFLESLEAEKLTELEEHLNSLPSAFDKSVQDSYEALLATTTSTEFETMYKVLDEEIVEAFTFAQRIALFHHRFDMLVAEGIDKPEDAEFPNHPVESFTNAAPFVAANTTGVETATEMQASLFSRLASTPAFFATTYSPVTTGGNGALVMSKNAEKNEDGTYTITLEAYTTGEVTVTQNVTPVDITLVLDVSGSMNFCMVCGETVYNNSTHITNQVYTEYRYNSSSYDNDNEYYYELEDGSYARAYYCQGRSSGSNKHSAGWYTQRHGSQSGHGGTRLGDASYTVYTITGTEVACTKRMDALEDAVQQFIDSVKTQNDSINADADKHRLAIVKFSGSGSVVQELTTLTNNNYNTMKTTVESLSPGGATQIDYGVSHAASIVTAAKAADSTRKQVVIIFTDGTPTSGNGFQVSVADNALTNAKTIKDAGATVYTISVAGGAQVNASGTLPDFPDIADITNESTYTGYLESPSVDCNYDSRAITDAEMYGLMNRFMHLLSSNNPTANDLYSGPARATSTVDGVTYTSTGQKKVVSGQDVWSSYYLVPTNADDLNAIFSQISDDVSGMAGIELGVSSTVKDIVTPHFTIPDRVSGVSVSTVDCLSYNEDTGEATWSETSASLGTTYTDESGATQKVVTISGNRVDVSGFDFSANFVAEQGRDEEDPNAIGDFHGRKLVITFDVQPGEYFLGGNGVATNGETTGVFDEEGTEVGEFAYPDVDVPIIDIDIDWADQYIYITNPADIDTLFKNATVKSRYDSDRETLANVLNGQNNKYVDIVFSVKEEDGPVLGTYTVGAGEELADGSWTLETGQTLNPVLLEDTTYELTWTITPKESGTVSAIEHTTPVKATVYVFKPVITFNDSTDWLGDELTYGEGTNYTANAEVWTHGTKGNATSNLMSGTKPTVVINCKENPTGTEGGIIVTTNDIPVQATVTITNEKNVSTTGVEGTHYTVVRAQCSDSDCTYRSDAKEAFVVHVDTVSLIVSKQVTGSENTSGEFKVTVAYASNADKKFTEDLTIGGINGKLNVTDGMGSIEFILKHGNKIELTGLPVGGYTVTEDDYSARYNTTVTGGTQVPDSNRSAYTYLSSKQIVNEIAFTNELKAGYLEITKVIEMPTGFEASATEEFTIVVKQGDEPVASVSLTNGKTCTPIELVAGTYTVVETVRGDLYDTHDSQNQTITIEAGKTTSATVINPAKTGSFSVTKSVIGNAFNHTPDSDETFEMQVSVNGYTGGELSYTLNDGTSGTTSDGGKFSIKHGQVATFNNMLVGSTFTVGENLTTDQEVVYTNAVISGDAVASDAIEYKIEDGKTESIYVNNTLKTGDIKIDKQVVMPERFDIPANTSFTFKVIDGKNADVTTVTLSAENNWTYTVENLLVGQYVVKEVMTDEQAKLYTVDTAEKIATVANGAETEVGFVNTAKTGLLQITKEVVDTSANEETNVDEVFEMTVIIRGVANGAILNYEVDGVSYPATDNKIVLKNGKTAVFHNLPAGVEYQVLENLTDKQASYYTATYDTNYHGTIEAGQTKETTITNTRKYGKLTITKVLQDKNGNALSANPGETFIFTVKNVKDNSTMQVVIAPQVNSSVTLTNLPLGEYIVEEDVNWSYKYNAVDASVETEVTATVDGQATIINKAKDDKWLKSDAYAENEFTAVTTSAN